MNCPWLERVALAMDGEWTAEIDAHVRECGDCSGLLEDRELLRSTPPLPQVTPILVPQRKLTWWPTAIAAAAAAVVLGWTLQPRQPEFMPAVALHHPIAPAVQARQQVAQAAQPVRQRRPVRQSARSFDAEQLAGSLVTSLHRPSAPSEAVTLYTDDPNVVIMLLPSKGETEDD